MAHETQNSNAIPFSNGIAEKIVTPLDVWAIAYYKGENWTAYKQEEYLIAELNKNKYRLVAKLRFKNVDNTLYLDMFITLYKNRNLVRYRSLINKICDNIHEYKPQGYEVKEKSGTLVIYTEYKKDDEKVTIEIMLDFVDLFKRPSLTMLEFVYFESPKLTRLIYTHSDSTPL